jgi:hypothetical protein
MRTEVKDLQDAERETHDLIRVVATQNELLRKDEMLRQQLQHERETRERDIRELRLEMRLQVAEELRRLPPG